MKQTKIVATVNATTATPELVRELYHNGMDVVRINSAHTSIEDMDRLVKIVRGVSDKLAIMVDTKGPNIRTANIENPVALAKGTQVEVTGETVPQSEAIQVNYPKFVAEVKVGQRIVFDDGAMSLKVLRKNPKTLTCEAMCDGIIKNRKSVNVPDAELKTPALTMKDRDFIDYAISNELDFIAHSFVRCGADVMAVKSILETSDSPIKIIAKIENRQGVDHLEEILDIADGVMVARGDLGIEIPLEEVPLTQKAMIRACVRRGKPVITATQMLQSMEESPLPTRAEVNDVANAVYDGTDAVMLSGETAQGKYPVEAISMMRRILEVTEKSPQPYFTKISDISDAGRDEIHRFMVRSAVSAADELPIRAIVCNSSSGETPRLCSALRPKLPIYTFSYRPAVVRQLSLTYGVIPMHQKFIENIQELQKISAEALIEQAGFAGHDKVIVLAKNIPSKEYNNLFCVSELNDFLN